MKPPTIASPFPGAKNIDVWVEGTKLHLSMDLTTTIGPSTSGKTTLIATTSGNRAIGSTGAFLGLNCYYKKVPRVTPDDVRRAIDEGGLRELRGVSFAMLSPTKLGCTVDMTGSYGASASGASHVIATSRGNISFGSSGLSLGLNCYCSDPAALRLENLHTVTQAEAQHHNVRIVEQEPSSLTIEMDLTVAGTTRKAGKGYCLASTASNGWKLQGFGGAVVTVMAMMPAQALAETAPNPAFSFGKGGCEIQGEITADRRLLLVVPLSDTDGKESASGKSMVLATTGGSKPIPSTALKVAVNVYRKQECASSTGEEEDVSLPALPSPSKVQKAVQEVLHRHGTDAESVSVKTLYKEVAHVLHYEGDVRDLRGIIKECIVSQNTSKGKRGE